MRYSINKDDLLLMVLAVFIPPLAVWRRKGVFDRDTLLNLLLFLLLFFPAIIHACYVVYETSDERTSERSRGRDLEAHPQEELPEEAQAQAQGQIQPPAYDYGDDDEARADVPLMDNKQQLPSTRA